MRVNGQPGKWRREENALILLPANDRRWRDANTAMTKVTGPVLTAKNLRRSRRPLFFVRSFGQTFQTPQNFRTEAANLARRTGIGLARIVS